MALKGVKAIEAWEENVVLVVKVVICASWLFH
jgi:hypothetical protein